MKNRLILDNDGTLSKFKKGSFKGTIGEDLKSNIKDYITDILNLNEEQYCDLLKDIKNRGYQLSEGFEKICGIDRNKYFYETWNKLYPENYIIDRNNIFLRNLIENKDYFNIMLTGAPSIWFKRTMEYLSYDINLFDKIYTAENFYNKSDIFSKIFSNKNLEIIKNSIAIGDEKNDYIHLQKIGGKGININNSIFK